jgi:hypothetical protein
MKMIGVANETKKSPWYVINPNSEMMMPAVIFLWLNGLIGVAHK